MTSGRATVKTAVSSRINLIALETLHPGPMQNVQVRQAMNYAINVDELVKSILAGRASRICGYASRYDTAYDAHIPCYSSPPEAIVQLLSGGRL